jgi:hypothetical protein
MAGFGGDTWGAGGGGNTPVGGPSTLAALISEAGLTGSTDSGFVAHNKTWPDPPNPPVKKGAPIFNTLNEMTQEPKLYAANSTAFSATAGAAVAGLAIAGLQ